MNQIPVLDAITISKSLEQSALLHRLLRIVLKDLPLEELLGLALDELLGVSWLSLLPKGGVFLVDQPGQSMILVAERDLGDEITRRCARIEFGECLCGRAAAEARIQHAACVDQRHDVRFEGMAPHGHYNVPIVAQGTVVGVLVVYLPHGHKRDTQEVEFLTSFADILALLITAKRREASIVETQRLLREALAETDSLMRTIRRHTIFSQAAPDGTITDVNEAFCRISGYSREELLSGPHNLLNSGIHPPAFWADLWSTLTAGQPWRGEICNRRKDGSLYWLDSIIMPMLDAEGGIERFLSVRVDVTERRQAEEKLARVGRILDDSSNEIYVFDAETLKFTLVNRGARENLGYSADEVLKLTPVDIKPELDGKAFADLIAPLLSRQTDRMTFEAVHRRKDGSTYPVEVNLHYAGDETPAVFVAIIQDISERKANDRRIEQLAFFDPLTGLANRALMVDRMHQAVARAERHGHNVCLLFLDLDRFKEINDTRGHAVGDQVLCEVARRFASVLRRSETLSRIGGDEFVAIVENVTRPNVQGIVGRLADQLSTPIEVEGKAHLLGVSIGIAAYPDDCIAPDSLLQLADIAMYEAKQNGGGHRFYDPDMGRNVAKRTEIAQRLTAALEGDRLQLHYQPFIDLHTGALCGAEALLRWHEPDWGFIRPDEFLPIAADRRMMSAIGDWVIDRACRQLRQWREAGLTGLDRVAINVAAEQMESTAILHRIAGSLSTHGTPADALEVEITESSMMTDPARAAETLRQLKDLGLGISIDDFGTGYSSLAYLKQFATDKLKIDMSFVRDLLDDPNTQAIIKATIAMAKSLGLKVLAEGVEKPEQAQRLRELGCHQAQGYLFGRPLPADAFATEWLRPAGGPRRG